MKKLHIISPFLLLSLLLLLLPTFHNALPSKVHATTKSVDFKVQAAWNKLKTDSIYRSNPHQEEKKAYNRPSGPNPVGNYRPPSRT